MSGQTPAASGVAGSVRRFAARNESLLGSGASLAMPVPRSLRSASSAAPR
jgi:hypothetical protein